MGQRPHHIHMNKKIHTHIQAHAGRVCWRRLGRDTIHARTPNTHTHTKHTYPHMYSGRFCWRPWGRDITHTHIHIHIHTQTAHTNTPHTHTHVHTHAHACTHGESAGDHGTETSHTHIPRTHTHTHTQGESASDHGAEIPQRVCSSAGNGIGARP